ncbi:hypothetical protein Scep_025908 [Stephania cephalantha]|uniref:Uncharacterized protein n=1 Tax=Stephania cephalantha TaxID=152367 RepID=A0AAP0HPT3_9MAGN
MDYSLCPFWEILEILAQALLAARNSGAIVFVGTFAALATAGPSPLQPHQIRSALPAHLSSSPRKHSKGSHSRNRMLNHNGILEVLEEPRHMADAHS